MFYPLNYEDYLPCYARPDARITILSSRQESNLHYKIRNLAFYPLNYGREMHH